MCNSLSYGSAEILTPEFYSEGVPYFKNSPSNKVAVFSAGSAPNRDYYVLPSSILSRCFSDLEYIPLSMIAPMSLHPEPGALENAVALAAR